MRELVLKSEGLRAGVCGIFREGKVTVAGIGKQQGPEARPELDTGPAGQ